MKRNKMTIIIVIFIIVILILSYYRFPGKLAIEEAKVKEYNNVILVQEGLHTGTGWVQVGDGSGIYPAEQRKDIIIEGKCPPIVGIVSKEGLNTFVCTIRYVGKEEFLGNGDEYDKYTITDWNPLYPIKRNAILPSFFIQNLI